MIIAIKSAIRGLGKLQSDPDVIARDIENRWEVLGEAVQTVMRRYGVPEPYEKLKELTRGQDVDQTLLHDFIQSLDIPDETKNQLLALTPSTYTGLAESLAKKIS